MEITELSPRLYLIKPVSGQVYLWHDGSRLTMVDTGIPGSQRDLASAFAELGFRREDLRRLVITHGHDDHAGSAAAIRAWGDVEVLAVRRTPRPSTRSGGLGGAAARGVSSDTPA